VLAQRAAKQAALRQAELAFARQERLLPSEAGSRADYESAEALLLTTRAELQALEAQLDQARIAVDTARVDVGYTRITAPMAGTVVAVVAEEGQTVNAAQATPTIVKIARLDTMTVKAQISEADVARVKPGLPATFTTLGAPDDRHPATLRAVEPAPVSYASASSSTTSSATSATAAAVYYNGLCDAPNPDGALRMSMTVQVSILLSRARGVLVVPAAAVGPRGPDGAEVVRVQQGGDLVPRRIRTGLGDGAVVEVLEPDGAEVVRVQQGGDLVPRRIRTGLGDGAVVEVLEGLAEGERVVVSEAAPDAGTSASASSRPPPPPGMF
jgi:macrolide-specific efflux system membrane fusion protein